MYCHITRHPSASLEDLPLSEARALHPLRLPDKHLSTTGRMPAAPLMSLDCVHSKRCQEGVEQLAPHFSSPSCSPSYQLHLRSISQTLHLSSTPIPVRSVITLNTQISIYRRLTVIRRRLPGPFLGGEAEPAATPALLWLPLLDIEIGESVSCRGQSAVIPPKATSSTHPPV